MSEQTTQPVTAPAVASSDWFCFRWWYTGRTDQGVTVKFSGRVDATDATSACRTVEAIMRAEHPRVRWMQGREIEGNGVMFGPTVQRLKRKQNDKLTDAGPVTPASRET